MSVTAKKDYGVRVITAFGQHHVGRVLYPPGIFRDRLVQLGCVERLTEATAPREPVQEPTKDEPAPVQEPAQPPAQSSLPLPAQQRRKSGRPA